MILTGPQVRVLHVHPTRRCNLECLHCYSSSGPDERAELPAPMLTQAIEDAARDGYNVVSVSGGEPLLYRELARLLDTARDCGMATAVTSNGTVLTPARVERLVGRAGLVTVSIDGAPDVHDRMRGRDGAFAALERGVELLRIARIPFGVIFTLTRSNAGDLPAAARFAADRRAALFQIHPLEETGRAALRLRGHHPGDEVCATAWLAARELRMLHPALPIHVDLVDRRGLAGVGDPIGDRLADLVSPLVIEADATVVPLQYGFPRAHALGSLADAPLPALARAWRRHRLSGFRAACRRTLDALAGPAELPFVDLYQELARV